ncbi:DNA-binding NarL/FixJ family response regulator [Thermosporothrix hazakensis]|jgi:DNA-binding NarL/FixJ family response regulator|uniref:DNA-binding NarL/FixJ family response regulator n=1 Tax=Thermosporothrix hazakensis TaxID=644383 RepID=A0A326U3A5_THEHA|nr:response regulator transcription factor family protein [Thermosporothrix hazakensis]PZW25664.1 DNA-binding NarL/FixJ family response regulator [Thermosporothrix hazakensis]GCE48159.1 hypothetical protein KTH_30280 [Thermosporothrix hazakensis]
MFEQEKQRPSPIVVRERLLQMLNTMLLQIKTLRMQTETATIQAGLGEIEQMTQQALRIVRQATVELALPELEQVSLVEALSNLIEETAEAHSLSSRISVTGDQSKEFSPLAGRLLYLVALEAVYLALTHTDIHRLRLILTFRLDDVLLSIEDDGLDARAPEEAPALPLMSMEAGEPRAGESPVLVDLRERLERVQGSLEILHLPERGVRVSAAVPYGAWVPESEPTADTAKMIRVLLVDASSVISAGLRHLLEPYPEIRIVGQASDSVQAVSETLELGPQVVLLDAFLPDESSIEAVRQIKLLNLDTRILLLATEGREEQLYEVLRAGADGCLLKDSTSEELAQGIRSVARGEVTIQPRLAGRLLSRVSEQGRTVAHGQKLTARELEVLQLLALGLRNKEIANRLYVSERTVNFHLANIYQKLGVSGRTEALSRAIALGLLRTGQNGAK